MIGRRESLRALLWKQGEESKRRHEESERRHEESMQYLEKRDKEMDAYFEKRDREVDAYVEEVRAYVAESKAARVQMRREGEERMERLRREGEVRTEEMREFMREILKRNEKVYTAVIAEAEEGRKQIAANTKAVLSVLDRLDGADGMAA